jgi:ABC-type glycerol-3-phosphate transport system substrate-binding protein
MTRSRKLYLVLALSLVSSAASACADAATSPSASLDTTRPCETQGSNTIVCK